MRRHAERLRGDLEAARKQLAELGEKAYFELTALGRPERVETAKVLEEAASSLRLRCPDLALATDFVGGRDLLIVGGAPSLQRILYNLVSNAREGDGHSGASHVSVRAEAGRIMAVLGPNAAGKSTLLRCIIGALRPNSGSVTIDGEDVHRLRPRALAQRVAYVPQRAIVSAAFNVRQVVELGRYALPSDSGRVADALTRLDLEEVAERPYRTLSAGQQQRVTMARALAQLAPQGVLVLDEPASAMDLRHIAQLHVLLREVASDGATVIVAMHDLSAAANLADQAWLLDQGRLVAFGETPDVLDVHRLQEIFGVEFAWVDDQHGRPRLLPELPDRRPA